MVEGPGCALNGEKLRARVRKGQTVVDVREAGPATPTNNNRGSFQIFSGCSFTGVETLGKELFLYFGQRALRIHFGMNGSMRINPTDQTGSPPSLVVQLADDTVYFYDSTVEIRVTEDCEQRAREMRGLDVCSAKFSFPRAEEAVSRQGGRMLCDVLLDQAVLPGVGNIIKNEALFDSGLHPAVKVEWLTAEQVRHLVKMTRDFTLLFYKCRKSGAALHKHYKVYRRPRCGQCGGNITACRLGVNSRMTYFCRHCQSGDPSQVNIGKLPSRNSLISWAYHGDTSNSDLVAKREEEEWACNLCTLINRPISKSCEACLTPRPKVATEPDPAPPSSSLIRYPCQSFSRPQRELKLNRRAAFGAATLVITDLSTKPADMSSPPSSAGCHLNSLAVDNRRHGSQEKKGRNDSTKEGRAASKRDPPDSCDRPHKKMRLDRGGVFGSPARADAVPPTAAQGTAASSPSVPRCASHRRPCLLRVVNKDGENRGRQFYACSLPREKQCKFFQWADLHFPACNHGRRCLMRTVLKLGPNNGRNFYVCPLKQGKQCGFFLWAEHGPGLGILPGC
ncbi:endonuclease 8-like 3 [Denticeps clupeoides]|nr:endonuclease 8-like 3 [Denticeps clupeoides]